MQPHKRKRNESKYYKSSQEDGTTSTSSNKNTVAKGMFRLSASILGHMLGWLTTKELINVSAGCSVLRDMVFRPVLAPKLWNTITCDVSDRNSEAETKNWPTSFESIIHSLRRFLPNHAVKRVEIQPVRCITRRWARRLVAAIPWLCAPAQIVFRDTSNAAAAAAAIESEDWKPAVVYALEIISNSSTFTCLEHIKWGIDFSALTDPGRVWSSWDDWSTLYMTNSQKMHLPTAARIQGGVHMKRFLSLFGDHGPPGSFTATVGRYCIRFNRANFSHCAGVAYAMHVDEQVNGDNPPIRSYNTNLLPPVWEDSMWTAKLASPPMHYKVNTNRHWSRDPILDIAELFGRQMLGVEYDTIPFVHGAHVTSGYDANFLRSLEVVRTKV